MADVELCSCEKVAHGELGPVDDAERLGRTVTQGKHTYISKDGKLKPGFFPPSHLESSGLSCDRIDRSDLPSLSTRVEAFVATDPTRKLVGIAVCVAKEIRAVFDSAGRRCLCVKDDPVKDDPKTPDNPAHAVILRTANQDRPEILRIQGVLTELFAAPIPVSDLYP